MSRHYVPSEVVAYIDRSLSFVVGGSGQQSFHVSSFTFHGLRDQSVHNIKSLDEHAGLFLVLWGNCA